VDESDTVFAYQFIGGVAFPVSKQLTIDLNYRYFATTDPSFPHGVGRLVVEYGGSNLLLGLRYNF
jgi:opacity protein-like surface antigen